MSRAYRCLSKGDHPINRLLSRVSPASATWENQASDQDAFALRQNCRAMVRKDFADNFFSHSSLCNS